ncbi:MAG: dihydropteroate synthase [Phycisphaerales bacterium]|nr:dihydropteroate synthase [Phycisphaerales bacterium]
MQILGIVNLTRDSFSDGGCFLEPGRAIAHALQLLGDGADWIDLGAQSTHPQAELVSADEELARLRPVVADLASRGVRVSIDTYRPEVVRALAPLGISMVNDVTGLRDPAMLEALAACDAKVIAMHATAPGPRATPVDVSPNEIAERIETFFSELIARADRAGVRRERLILDPGMGFFLSRDPRVSLRVLRDLGRLRRLGLPLCVSTSRKSFIGVALGTPGEPRPPSQRAAGTLASELWAAAQGADYIRTHDVGALRDALTVWRAIAEA